MGSCWKQHNLDVRLLDNICTMNKPIAKSTRTRTEDVCVSFNHLASYFFGFDFTLNSVLGSFF